MRLLLLVVLLFYVLDLSLAKKNGESGSFHIKKGAARLVRITPNSNAGFRPENVPERSRARTGAAAEKTRKRKQKNGERIQAILEKREKKEKKSQERQKFFKEGAAVFKRLLTSTKALTMTGKDKIESVNSAQVGKIVKSVQARTGIKKNPAVQSMKANANMPTYSSTGNDCCDCMNMFLIIGELKNQNARSGGRRANKSGSRGVRSKPGKTRSKRSDRDTWEDLVAEQLGYEELKYWPSQAAQCKGDFEDMVKEKHQLKPLCQMFNGRPCCP